MIIDIGLYLSYALVIICAAAAIIAPIVQSFSNPQSLVKSGIGVLAVAVVFLIGYVLADDTAYDKASPTVSQLVGAGLITMYIFTFVALLGIVYTEISKMIK